MFSWGKRFPPIMCEKRFKMGQKNIFPAKNGQMREKGMRCMTKGTIA